MGKDECCQVPAKWFLIVATRGGLHHWYKPGRMAIRRADGLEFSHTSCGYLLGSSGSGRVSSGTLAVLLASHVVPNLCVDMRAYNTALMQAELMTFETQKVDHLLFGFFDECVLQWIRLINGRQPEAEFVFIGTKTDLLRFGDLQVKENLTDILKRMEMYVKELEKDVASRRAVVGNVTHGAGSDSIAKLLDAERVISRAKALFKPTWVVMSCVDDTSIAAASRSIQNIIMRNSQGFLMSKTYSQVLTHVKVMRPLLGDSHERVEATLSNIKSIWNSMKVSDRPRDMAMLENVLHTLHDLGDVLWYDDQGIESLKDTIFLDPLIMIDFVRQVVNHNSTSVTMSNVTLRSQPFWSSVDEGTYVAMKKVLQYFQLVHPTIGSMDVNSDLLVPAYWKSKPCAVAMFAKQRLELGPWDSPRSDITTRVDWEWHFFDRLPLTVYDQLVVESYSPFDKREVGPDWIEYKHEEEYACRFTVIRDHYTLRRIMWLEVVIAKTAQEGVAELWTAFYRLCDALKKVLVLYAGLSVLTAAHKERRTSVREDSGEDLRSLVTFMTRERRPVRCAFMPPVIEWLMSFVDLPPDRSGATFSEKDSDKQGSVEHNT